MKEDPNQAAQTTPGLTFNVRQKMKTRFQFRLSPRPRLVIYQDLSEKAVIKKTAHALTVLVVAWIGVSVLGIVAYLVGKEDGHPDWTAAAIWAWRLHAGFALLALAFWFFEKPSEVRYVRETWNNGDQE